MSLLKSADVFKYWRIRTTVLEMLRDRGFNVSVQDLAMTEKVFKDQFEGTAFNNLCIYEEHLNKKEVVSVVFIEEKKFNVDSIRTCLEATKQHLGSDNKSVSPRLIFIIKDVTPNVKKQIDIFNQQNIHIEIFLEKEMMYNLTKHVLVPRHCLLSDEEKQEVLSRYAAIKSQMPKILHTDPVARYFGAKRDQMFKIFRKSETAGLYIAYRIVA